MPTTEQIRRYLTMFACGPPTTATGVLLNFVFSAGQTQTWFSRHGSQNIGIVVSGSRDMLGSPVVLSRVWERGDATFQLQQNGAGASWSDWVAAYPDATITITTPNGVVTFLSANT